MYTQVFGLISPSVEHLPSTGQTKHGAFSIDVVLIGIFLIKSR